jgi:hypothetical protein
MKRFIYSLLIAMYVGGAFMAVACPKKAGEEAPKKAPAEEPVKAEKTEEERIHDAVYGVKLIDSNHAAMKEAAKFADGGFSGYATLVSGSDIMICLAFDNDNMANAIRVAEATVAAHYKAASVKPSVYRVYLFDKHGNVINMAVLELEDAFKYMEKFEKEKAGKGAAPKDISDRFLQGTVEDKRTKKK